MPINIFPVKRGFQYLRYNISRPHHNGHGIHSPFLYNFIINVLNNKANSSKINEIITLRSYLLKDNLKLNIEDMGAGSKTSTNGERTIKNITTRSSSTVKYGRLLHNIVTYYQPDTVIELGTCIGLGTSFMATACPSSEVITIEGSDKLLQIASKNFEYLRINNVTTLHGNFNNVLPLALNQVNKADIIFIDGNHKKDATLSYFNACLPFMNNEGIIILDDIHWSSEMYQVWREIIKDTRVNLSIDLFQLGIVFLNTKLQKEHFQIYY